MKRLSYILVSLLIVVSAGLYGCDTLEREYKEDIVYELPDSENKIIIKEWEFLQGSGAEIYLKKGEENPVLLGKISCADDGFCPFEAGLYEITQDENSITVSWCYDPTNEDRSSWRSQSFELPED